MYGPEEATLAHLAAAWDCPLSGPTAAGIVAYIRLLLAWNVKVNLTAARSADDVVGEHVVDSFAAARVVPRDATVVDVGAGGGLPGIPLALLRRDCRMTLVEPRAKRVAFLRTAVREAGLDAVRVLRSRAEELPPSGFDVALSRATFAPDSWLPMGLGLARPAGLVLVFAAVPYLAAPTGSRLVDSAVYRTAAGHRRWLGVFAAA